MNSWWLQFDLGLAIVVIVAAILIVPSPFRDALKKAFRINIKKAKDAGTTAIERELALIAEPQRVIDEAQQQVQDLRGALRHENDVLLLRQDDLNLAEGAYFKVIEEKGDQDAVEQSLILVAEKEEDVGLQQKVVSGLESAVATACSAVNGARRELRRLQMTVKSDEAKAKATGALETAARVIEQAQTIGAAGGALHRESRQVDQEFESAKARVEMAQGGESEARAIRQQAQLDEVRRRLEARHRERQPADAN